MGEHIQMNHTTQPPKNGFTHEKRKKGTKRKDGNENHDREMYNLQYGVYMKKTTTTHTNTQKATTQPTTLLFGLAKITMHLNILG
jgi:hypothetical protein